MIEFPGRTANFRQRGISRLYSFPVSTHAAAPQSVCMPAYLMLTCLIPKTPILPRY
jgi:hypothetical protein